MHISKNDLDRAVSQGILSAEQAEQLWQELYNRTESTGRFNFINILYYLGAFIVLVALTWFLAEEWEFLGGKGIFSIAAVYGLLFTLLGLHLHFRTTYQTAGGLFFLLAIGMVGLIVYGLQKWLGLWPASYDVDTSYLISANWMAIYLSTLLASALALYFIRFPFLVAPLAFSFWMLGVTTVDWLQGQVFFTQDLWASVVIGIVLIAFAVWLDLRTSQDYAFWAYFFGALALWFGLIKLWDGEPALKALYAALNIVFLFVSALLNRVIFAVLGGLGILAYLCYLAYSVFADSVLFPLVLSLIGIGIIGLGIYYQRRYAHIQAQLLRLLPDEWQSFFPLKPRH